MEELLRESILELARTYYDLEELEGCDDNEIISLWLEGPDAYQSLAGIGELLLSKGVQLPTKPKWKVVTNRCRCHAETCSHWAYYITDGVTQLGGSDSEKQMENLAAHLNNPQLPTKPTITALTPEVIPGYPTIL